MRQLKITKQITNRELIGGEGALPSKELEGIL